ncbi:mitogen-activated protein kinase kinase kinase 19 isoform X2 [Hemibagrus wyckioides]|uniref:mitogen-activated protein kinase kinase kinase 19 isoform X2 n=1 Tax=Hemibagrus wyckioides TaxID=337641 RepID=UPI00266D777F|nr:mitogen-activated protein kinase kinase kinase 19 isoform X2 [Hemibagrus wyckioides]
MKMEERSFVDLLFKGELEAVSHGLEDGLYSWEELNQPHNAQGSTPLISACQMGLNLVMHFLLERGADATLCNHSNQTALHVSQPDLQKELLAAMLRHLAHPAQLLEVAWRGDIHTLERLLIETDSVEVNIQNQNGLTPLMLAVRDVDLFEGFQGTMGWDYDPTKVVKTLLAQSANMDIQDRKSCTVLTYVSQIKSSMKDELLRIILEHQTQSVPAPVVPEFHFPAEPCKNSHRLSSSHMFSTLANEEKDPYKYIAIQEDHNNIHQDNIIALCFHSAMEPKMYSKSPGHTTLPRLKEMNKCWTKFGILYPTCDISRKTSLVPIPPGVTEKTKSILETPPVPNFSQLSQSAPSLALLDANFLLQVRTNIHNRLSSSDVAGQKDGHPVPCPRTPKHLAPLDQEYRDGHVLSNFQCPLAPKLTDLLSFGSKGIRETLSRLSSKGSRGSEESSYSSQSSLDEEEEDENGPQLTGQIFGTTAREPHFALVAPSSAQQLMNTGIIEPTHTNKQMPNKSKFIRHQKLESRQDSVREFYKTVKSFERTLNKQQRSEDLDVCEENRTIYLADVAKMNKSVELTRSLSNELDEPKDTITEPEPGPEKGQSSSFVDPEQYHVSPVHHSPVETNKASKMTRAEEIKCRSHTNQLIILDQINIRQDYGMSKKNRRSQSSQVIIKEKGPICNDISEEKMEWPKMAPINHGPKLKDAPLNRRRTQESLHQGRLSGTKKISNKPQSQKQLLNRDTKKTTRQAKRPGILGTQRTKSSLDYVSYRDMFLEIRQAAEGPAIFEMFATPVYENLRAASSVERPKQVQSAAQFKRQPSGQQRAQKPVEGNRRKQKCTTSKGKPRKRKETQPPEQQRHDQAIDSKQNDASVIPEMADNNQKRKHNPLTTEEDSDDRLQTEGNPVLSMIREVPSDTDIELAFHNKQEGLSSSFQSHRTPYLSMQFFQEDIISNVIEDSIAVQLPSQPLINTWTTDRTKSPVYQKILDEVGEGPVTDDLLKRLAEELISLEEKEVETLNSENPEMANDALSKFKELFSEVTPLDNLHHTERSSVDDTITWTKGDILGRGAYGTVYCGLTSQGQLIAVKQVTLDISNSDTAEKEYERLEREVDLLKNLHHQNIVGFLGTALSGNVISILMEYIPGGSISNVLNRFGPLPEKVFALYTHQILEGVAYLHDNRVIHRDLKGNNIMLMPSGVIKLIDFGCARRLNRITRSGSRSDFLKSVHGTPYWMAPEVINETGHGKKSDIWSIGCTVFEMATGKPPLAHMGKMAALFYIGAQKGLMPSLPDDFSIEAKGFVQACLTTDQKQRPSAEDLLRHPFVFHLQQSASSKLSNIHH